ncbi:MAG: FkbM family methyltransferase [Acidobacteriota bacterium]|nr:FkbM family methyltransferase [Acidobacteriota bacterium]
MDKEESPESTASVSPQQATEEDVYHAYRLLLGREPDDDGFLHYRKRISEGLSLAALVQIFMGSDEYREHHDRTRLGHETSVDLGGYHVIVDRRDPDFGAVIANSQIYEEPIRQVLRDRLVTDDVCLDIGANIGVMTLLAASLVGPRGRVIAVEPNPDNVQLLYKGLLRNRFTNVEVLPLAAADRRSVFAMSGLSNTELIHPDTASPSSRLTQSVILDEILGQLPRLDFVKLDIEGQEPAALRGLHRLVATHRPTLLAEFNPRCLGHHKEDESAFLNWILQRYPRVRVISHFGDDQRFTNSADILTFWRRRATEVTSAGSLPKGMLHFDLVTEQG